MKPLAKRSAWLVIGAAAVVVTGVAGERARADTYGIAEIDTSGFDITFGDFSVPVAGWAITQTTTDTLANAGGVMTQHATDTPMALVGSPDPGENAYRTVRNGRTGVYERGDALISATPGIPNDPAAWKGVAEAHTGVAGSASDSVVVWEAEFVNPGTIGSELVFRFDALPYMEAEAGAGDTGVARAEIGWTLSITDLDGGKGGGTFVWTPDGIVDNAADASFTDTGLFGAFDDFDPASLNGVVEAFGTGGGAVTEVYPSGDVWSAPGAPGFYEFRALFTPDGHYGIKIEQTTEVTLRANQPPVPEPAALGLAGLALGALIWRRRRR